MVKGIKLLPFLSHSKSFDPDLLSSSSSPPRSAFPSCGGHIKTLSFSFPAKHNNSAFLDTYSSSSRTFSTMSEEDMGDPVEASIQRGLRSDRFFFEPEQSSSLVNEKLSKNKGGCSSVKQVETEENIADGYKKSEMLWVDCSNPFEENRVSGYKKSEELWVDSSNPFACSPGKHVKIEENTVVGYKESEMLWVDSSNPFECSCGKQEETTEIRVVGYKENEMLWADSSHPFENFKQSISKMVEEDEKVSKNMEGCSSGKQVKTEESIVFGYKESEMLFLDSSNPFEDFKQSMAEMVEAHGLMKDWDALEHLLSCYLEINGKNNHGYILGAFIDLLASFSPPLNSASTTRTTTTTTTTTTMSSSSVSSSSSIVYSSPSSPQSLLSSCLTPHSFSSALDHHVEYDRISS